MNKFYATQEIVLERAGRIIGRQLPYLNPKNTDPFCVYGVPRGGVPVALTVCALAEGMKLNWRPTDDPKRANLIVDDIIDSGSTRAKLKLVTPATFDALFSKFEREDKDLGWVVFPWEDDAREEDDNTIVGTLRNRFCGKPPAGSLANTNIASVFASDEERTQYQAEISCRCRHLLDGLLLDVDGDPNLKGTPDRLAKMYVREVMAGRFNPPPDCTEFPNTRQLDEMYVTGPIDVRSLCAHHFAPIIGQAWIGVIPGETLAGLSKYDRIVDWYATRPQMQEELTVQIADHLEKQLQPRGLAVVIKAEHLCKTWRGVRACRESTMTTSVMRGAFKVNTSTRIEFLSLAK